MEDPQPSSQPNEPTDVRDPIVLGAARGAVRVAEDFDAPLDDELLDLFEGRDRS